MDSVNGGYAHLSCKAEVVEQPPCSFSEAERYAVCCFIWRMVVDWIVVGHLLLAHQLFRSSSFALEF